MGTPRALHTATTLNDGRVLVAGGVDCTFYISVVYASAEIFDPRTSTWSPTNNMNIARYRHTATLLNDGRVLVVDGSTAEIYNPSTGTWSATGSLTSSRYGHTATLLNNGRVLVTGGFGNSGNTAEPITGFLNLKTAAGLSQRSVDSYKRILEQWPITQGIKRWTNSPTGRLMPIWSIRGPNTFHGDLEAIRAHFLQNLCE